MINLLNQKTQKEKQLIIYNHYIEYIAHAILYQGPRFFLLTGLCAQQLNLSKHCR